MSASEGNDLPVICSFWHGPLGWLERLCLSSFAEQGHRVDLYAYDRPDGLPDGVTWRDAGGVIARDRMFFYKDNRSPAVFSDLFRLELLKRGAGLWADCDVLCVRPFAGLGDHVFGVAEDPGWRNLWRAEINNAVLGLPVDSPALAAMLALFDSDTIPPGVPFWRRAEIGLRKALGQNVPLHHMQFGVTGPAPLTHFLREQGLTGKAQPRDVFYPLGYGRAADLLEPGTGIEAVMTGNTLGVHMWRSALTGRGSSELRDPARGSFFAEELARRGLG